MNHVKYYQLVKCRGIDSAFVSYRRDGGSLPLILFTNKYAQ